jgi:hypothetical protein
MATSQINVAIQRVHCGIGWLGTICVAPGAGILNVMSIKFPKTNNRIANNQVLTRNCSLKKQEIVVSL